MFKVLASLLVLAVSASTINGFSINAPTNRATNQWSPYAQIHENHMQNSYVYDEGYNRPHYGFLGPLANGIRINKPISHSTNLMSAGAGIFNNDVQNSQIFRGYY